MSKICRNCSCENDERYIFCKNCGTPLEEHSPYVNNPYENINVYSEESRSDFETPTPEQMDGASLNEIAIFVGKNSDKFISKFSRLEGLAGKSTWCWPAAILGGLLGFIGAALWLLYRKMYKPAFLAIGIALVLTTSTTVITYDLTKQIGETYNRYISEVIYIDNVEARITATEEYAKEIKEITSSEEYANAIRFANFLNNAECFMAAFVFGGFGVALYKKHTIKKIKAYNQKNGMSEYYNFGLKTLGGTSGGALALGIVIAAIIPTAIKLIPFIIAFI